MLKHVVMGCLAVALLGGCASDGWREGIRPWWTLTEREFGAIKQGATSTDVEAMVGKPLAVEHFARLGEDVWDYRFLDHSVSWYAAEVHFRGGQVASVVAYPDHCSMGPIGCP